MICPDFDSQNQYDDVCANVFAKTYTGKIQAHEMKNM